MASLIFSGAILITSTPVLGTSYELRRGSSVCTAQGYTVQFALSVMNSSWLFCAYALHAVVAGSPEKMEELNNNKNRHLLLITVTSVILTALPAYTLGLPGPQTNGLFCWLYTGADFFTKMTSCCVEMILILIAGFYYIARVVFKVFKVIRCDVYGAIKEHGIKEYALRHFLMLFLYALVIICLIQESANGTALVGASRSKPNATTSNGFTAHPFLLASEIAFTYTLSSLGIFGFLIFGTSHALRKTWWKCLFSDTEYDNNNTTHYVGPTYSIAGSHRNSSDSSSASSTLCSVEEIVGDRFHAHAKESSSWNHSDLEAPFISDQWIITATQCSGEGALGTGD